MALRVGKKTCILLAAMWEILRLGWALVSQSLQILTAPLINSTPKRKERNFKLLKYYAVAVCRAGLLRCMRQRRGRLQRWEKSTSGLSPLSFPKQTGHPGLLRTV